MSASDKAMNRAAENRRNYVYAAGFFAIFGSVYELFGGGVFSPFMVFAFLVPLIMGALPFHIAMSLKCEILPPRHTTQLYGGGIAMLTMWCTVRGILDICGKANPKSFVFIPAGIALMAAAAISWMLDGARRRKKR